MTASWIKVILLTLGWLWTSQRNISHSAVFEQVRQKKVILMTLNKSDKTSINFTDFKQHSQSGLLWLPARHCATPVWLTGRHAILFVTRYFPAIIYHECYGFERALFTVRGFLTCTPSCWFSRASCWSLKHSPGQAIASNYSNLQKRYTGKFYLCA